MSAEYDVFISYRRSSGSAEARLIRGALMEKGLRVFLDVTDLGPGLFDEALLNYIAQARNFVLILSPGALDRGNREEDWFRREIQQALGTSRNIVPVFVPGFAFPPELPEDLRNLPRHQGVDYSHRYFDAMIAEILRVCCRTPQPPPPPPVPKRRRTAAKLWIGLGVLTMALAAGSFALYYAKSNANRGSPPVPESVAGTSWHEEATGQYFDFALGGKARSRKLGRTAFGGTWRQVGDHVVADFKGDEIESDRLDLTISGKNELRGTDALASFGSGAKRRKIRLERAPTQIDPPAKTPDSAGDGDSLPPAEPPKLAADPSSLTLGIADSSWSVAGSSAEFDFLTGGAFQYRVAGSIYTGKWMQDGTNVTVQSDLANYQLTVSGNEMTGTGGRGGTIRLLRRKTPPGGRSSGR